MFVTNLCSRGLALIFVLLATFQQRPVSAQDASELTTRRQLADAVLQGELPIHQVPAKSAPNAQKLSDALEMQVGPVSLNGKPLRLVLQYFSKELDIPIHLDIPELDLLSIDPDTPITISAPSIRFRSLIVLMLEPLELTYMLRHDVLEITTSDAANAEPSNEVYRLPDILSGPGSGQAIAMIEGTVDPDSWLTNGGTSNVLVIAEKLLVVSAPTSTQYKVQELLGKIAEKSAPIPPAGKGQ